MKNKNILTMILSMFSLICVLFAAQVKAAEIASPNEALYKAANLSMLSQRMLKYYALIGQNVRARKSQEELNDSIGQFEEGLAALQAYAEDDASRNNLRDLAAAWSGVQANFTSAPSKDSAEQVREQSEAMLQASDRTFTSLQAHLSVAGGEQIRLAGKQAMLSQRIAATYALMAWGYADQYLTSYKASYQAFNATQDKLTGHAGNSAPINKTLKKIARQFKRIKVSKGGQGDVYVPGLVDRSAEKVLESSNDVTGMYASLK